MQSLLLGLAALLVLGMAAQWIAWRLGLPSILLLLVFGFLAGSEWLDLGVYELFEGRDDLLFAIVSASVAVILFEGGLSLRLEDLRRHGRVTLRLVSLGALVTWGLGALAAHGLAGLGWPMALLLGALLTVSGPTVVLPLLRQIKPRGRVASVLKWEGIAIDPIGAVLAVLVFEGLELPGLQQATGHGLVGLGKTLLIGGGGGLLGGWALVQMLKRYWVPDYLHNPVTLAMVVGVFALTNAGQHESGLLAVTVMGVVAANQASVSVRHILEFKENLRVLLISGLFILLASRLRAADLQQLDLGSVAFLFALILVVRPLAVLVSARGSRLDRAERIFLAWLCPRGIVAAAVASVFALKLDPGAHPDALRLVPLTFLVIVGTVVVYGLTAGALARRLALSVRNPQGVLFVGAHSWARDMAAALKNEGVPVFLVDSNRRNVAAARMAELPVRHGSALEEHPHEFLDLTGMGRVLAMTPNDELNTFVAVHYLHQFGRREVYQLAPDTVPAKGKATAPPELHGRWLFAEQADYYHLSARFARGKVKVTSLTAQFDYASFQEVHGERALPLFTIAPDGTVAVIAADQHVKPPPGHRVVAIVEERRPDEQDAPGGPPGTAR